jgi:hypothetical protein
MKSGAYPDLIYLDVAIAFWYKTGISQGQPQLNLYQYANFSKVQLQELDHRNKTLGLAFFIPSS